MLITFIESVKYSEDGHVVMQGVKGETQDVAHTAAMSLLQRGKAYNSEPWSDFPTEPRDVEARLREANMAEAKIQGLIP